MAKTPSDHLLYSLEELVPYDFEKFKFKLQNTSLEKEYPRIPRGQLQTARPVKLATLLLTHYGEKSAVQLTLQVLRAINQHLLAEWLQRVTGLECPIKENGTGYSAMSSSSGENKPDSLRIPNGLESDRQQQSSDEPEAGRGPQKKLQGKRRDQKGSEGLDVQGKPGARGVTLSSRRSPVPSNLQKEKGSNSSVRLRRNASSAGRLQGLSSASFPGSPGRKECKLSEVYAPSKKNRPKSLEFTISSGEREPPHPETLLPQEKMRSENLDSAATPSKGATLDVGAIVAPEEGSRNPEHSLILAGEAFRNMLSNVLLAGEEKTWEHPESKAPSEKTRIEGPETPETLGEVVGSVLHELSNPEVPPSSGQSMNAVLQYHKLFSRVSHILGNHWGQHTRVAMDKPCPGKTTFKIMESPLPGDSTAMSPARLLNEAVCPLCRAQEGNPVGGTCVHGSCSCSVASRDPKALGGCLLSCPRGQASHPGKNSEGLEQQESPQMASLSPKAVLQREHHMKQVQLLFCEDHGQPICLICSLRQEHQGHRVRPMEEAALEYKEQIQKQLEHLKELRKLGVEQRSQGDQSTAKYLKQTEIQKQRVRYQLEQLCWFLEQQEQLFMAWLEELGQTIGQVRETYDIQVSQDIALLNGLIEELEAKQRQAEWELMQDIRVTLYRYPEVPW